MAILGINGLKLPKRNVITEKIRENKIRQKVNKKVAFLLTLFISNSVNRKDFFHTLFGGLYFCEFSRFWHFICSKFDAQLLYMQLGLFVQEADHSSLFFLF